MRKKESIIVYSKEYLKEIQTVLVFTPTRLHKHEFWEFVYWIKGESKNVFKTTSFDTLPGMVLFIRPNDVHENRPKNSAYLHRDIYVVEENLKEICDLLQEGLFEELKETSIPITFKITMEDVQFLERLVNQASVDGTKLDAAIQKSVISTLLGLYLTIKKTAQKHSKPVEEMINEIDAILQPALNNGEILETSLESLAEKINYSYFYVSRLFKKQVGESPKEYFSNKKMAIAATLLLNDESISQVSTRLLYTDNAHFIRAFKKYYGLTPLAWKKQYRKNEKDQ